VPEAQIAIIGGSGLYEMEGMTGVRQVDLDTPFGKPSDSIVLGKLEGVDVAFLPRHGRGHHITPTHLPVRANIFALKTLGVGRIISISAVGSLREDVKPLDLVVPDQLIDRTRQRAGTFFDSSIVAHVGFADPFCPVLSDAVYSSARAIDRENGAVVHRRGTYVVMEGPAFSTRAESALYRSWGADLIGMTALPEAKLAREAEICYSTLACVTDYDCWHESEGVVTVEMVVANLMQNVETSRRMLRRVITRIPTERACPCASALENSIITSKDRIPDELKEKLGPIVGKYLK
jgi:5'-methylthioadenosine phosphorylase